MRLNRNKKHDYKLQIKYVGHIKCNKEDRRERGVLEWTDYRNERREGRQKEGGRKKLYGWVGLPGGGTP